MLDPPSPPPLNPLMLRPRVLRLHPVLPPSHPTVSVLPTQDKDGYTPLHIAAGYLHKGIVRKLLDAGADPELEDKKGRSPLALVQSIKDSTPSKPEFFSRRSALDEVAKELESHLFEELEPLAILAKRVEGCAGRPLSIRATCSPAWVAHERIGHSYEAAPSLRYWCHSCALHPPRPQDNIGVPRPVAGRIPGHLGGAARHLTWTGHRS